MIKYERVIDLVLQLLGGNVVTVDKHVEKFNVSTKTARRDIKSATYLAQKSLRLYIDHERNEWYAVNNKYVLARLNNKIK